MNKIKSTMIIPILVSGCMRDRSANSTTFVDKQAPSQPHHLVTCYYKDGRVRYTGYAAGGVTYDSVKDCYTFIELNTGQFKRFPAPCGIEEDDNSSK